jgi:hypothetical protein
LYTPAPAGVENVTVQKNNYLVLEPGDYHKIEVKDNGVLLLTGGVYNLHELKLKKNAELMMADATEIRIEDKLEAKKNTYIGPDADSSIGASDIIFYIASDHDHAAKIEQKADFFGTVYAPNGRVELKKEVNATGAFLAREVKVEKECVLVLDSYFGGSGLTKGNYHSFANRTLVPDTFVLNSAYPNPFNPTTTISYSLPTDASVSLYVYDIAGREIAELINSNSQQIAGNYAVDFDATDLSSGLYFVMMKANSANEEFVTTQKVILLK